MRTSAIASLNSTALFLGTPQHQLERAVDAGITALDKRRSQGSWESRIDIERLDIASPRWSPIAQAHGMLHLEACADFGFRDLDLQHAHGLCAAKTGKKDSIERLNAIWRQKLGFRCSPPAWLQSA